MKLFTEETISSSHFLPNYIGKCSKNHGHNWKIRVEIEGEKNEETGMLIDFSLVKKVIRKLDHESLNDFIPNPTAENIGEYIIKELRKTMEDNYISLITVRIHETENNIIEVSD